MKYVYLIVFEVMPGEFRIKSAHSTREEAERKLADIRAYHEGLGLPCGWEIRGYPIDEQ